MAKLQVSPMFDLDAISYEKESEVYLDVVLTAPDKTDLKCLPLHLILAIDCSGSMDNGKLTSVKSTVDKLIMHLTENDSLGIIGFSDTVWSVTPTLPMTKENKEQARKSVKELKTLSATNLSGAMTEAMERAVTADKEKISRIILLTDGLPSAGKCAKDDLIQIAGNIPPSVSMTTFGYGMDFDSELMASISRMGKGNNFYIQKDEDCNKAFATELGGLLSIFAQNIMISLTPTGNVTFNEILSEYKCEQRQGYRLLTGKKVNITIDDIYYGEKKHVVLKLTVPLSQDTNSVPYYFKVCDLEIGYLEAETKDTHVIGDGAQIQYVAADMAQKDQNIEVKKQLMLLEVAKIQKEAMEKAEKGDLAGARNALDIGKGFVNSNVAFFDNAVPVLAMYDNLSANYTNHAAYTTRGRSLSTSYSTAFVNSRLSSADTADMAYTSGIQEKMMKSFLSTTGTEVPDPTVTPESPING